MILISATAEIVKATKWQRETIDRLAYGKGISWHLLRQLMVKWCGNDGVLQVMNLGEANVVIKKLKERR